MNYDFREMRSTFLYIFLDLDFVFVFSFNFFLQFNLVRFMITHKTRLLDFTKLPD